MKYSTFILARIRLNIIAIIILYATVSYSQINLPAFFGNNMVLQQKTMESTEEGKINLFFDYCPNGLASFGMELTGFEIAGDDKVFYPATAKIYNNRTVTVFSEKVAKPVAVHYGFIPCPKGTPFNIEGLPASPFRTDDWEKKTNYNI